MKNIRNHKDTKPVKTRDKFTKHVIKPNFKDGYPFSKELFSFEIRKTNVKMNKLICLGSAILDLIETLMYVFH